MSLSFSSERKVSVSAPQTRADWLAVISVASHTDNDAPFSATSWEGPTGSSSPDGTRAVEAHSPARMAVCPRWGVVEVSDACFYVSVRAEVASAGIRAKKKHRRDCAGPVHPRAQTLLTHLPSDSAEVFPTTGSRLSIVQ